MENSRESPMRNTENELNDLNSEQVSDLSEYRKNAFLRSLETAQTAHRRFSSMLKLNRDKQPFPFRLHWTPAPRGIYCAKVPCQHWLMNFPRIPFRIKTVASASNLAMPLPWIIHRLNELENIFLMISQIITNFLKIIIKYLNIRPAPPVSIPVHYAGREIKFQHHLRVGKFEYESN